MFSLTQSHAWVSFLTEKGSWHFEKSHFPTHSASRSGKFSPERKRKLAFWGKSFSHSLCHTPERVFPRAKKGSWHFEKSHFSTYSAPWSSGSSERKRKLAFWEKSFSHSLTRTLELVSRTKRVAGILRKVIFSLIQSHGSISFSERRRELAFWEKSFSNSLSRTLDNVSGVKRVADISRKVISSRTQTHARVSFSSEMGSWHFEKSHFSTYSVSRSSRFP